MNYAIENITASLKEHRENKGLSQRELSALSGVPQSHISKIESNAVDLRLSSLASLAHALDLELIMIPRKAASAVRSIIRSTGNQKPQNSNDALRELTRAQRALDTLPQAFHKDPAMQSLQKQFRELNSFPDISPGVFPGVSPGIFPDISQETSRIRNIRNALEALNHSREDSKGVKTLEKIARDTRRLCNILTQKVPSRPVEQPAARPAYSLDEDDSDG
ncbi:helix-turn-helix domain-containing protein [Kiloniella laminariae]|uniref:helix-turn-helix domain-containing protein n=1 Tax=Kiloniella laminariae TaxID=454162 RepID=UPI000381FB73|nr:helix-turn-helix transcriptional regulator [Kiloniella laminariae]